MFVTQCRMCHREFEINVTAEQVDAWQQGMALQRAMPDLSANDRELIKTGHCGDCFDKITGGHEQAGSFTKMSGRG